MQVIKPFLSAIIPLLLTVAVNAATPQINIGRALITATIPPATMPELIFRSSNKPGVMIFNRSTSDLRPFFTVHVYEKTFYLRHYWREQNAFSITEIWGYLDGNVELIRRACADITTPIPARKLSWQCYPLCNGNNFSQIAQPDSGNSPEKFEYKALNAEELRKYSALLFESSPLIKHLPEDFTTFNRNFKFYRVNDGLFVIKNGDGSIVYCFNFTSSSNVCEIEIYVHDKLVMQITYNGGYNISTLTFCKSGENTVIIRTCRHGNDEPVTEYVIISTSNKAFLYTPEVELDVEILIQPYWMRSEYWWDEDNEE